MRANIDNKLKTLPLDPGCYLMKNKNDEIIYVGKAKSLKKRVNQYFVGAHDHKTTKMVSQIDDFEYIVTSSEKEALLLELNLIKKHQPRFNIIFKDSKTYPYIKLTAEKHPILKIARNTNDKKAKYFGPFPDSSKAYESLNLLNRIYPLRKCANLGKKECLYYHLGQCLAPCVNQVVAEDYDKITNSIAKFFKGDISDIIIDLEKKMLEASEKLEFEKAKDYRDQIKAIEYINEKQKITIDPKMNYDIFACSEYKGYLSICGLFIKNGRLLERELNISALYTDKEEALLSFILQFYQNNPLPKEIIVEDILDKDLLAQALNTKVICPLKGRKKELISLAKLNAKTTLEQKFEVINRQDENTSKALQQLAKLLKIKSCERIEIFDNSHISGAFQVSGMVVFINGKPNKNEYRRFKLKNEFKGDDLKNMEEVIYRRYYRVLSENLIKPDLIIVDGGYLQIKAAKQVLASLDLDIKVVGLIKDQNHDTSNLMDSNFEIIQIEKTSSLFYFLANMQDEVHRYAISYHQKIRTKSLFASLIDEVDGIGSVRKKLLLKKFKSVKQMKEASMEELMEILPKEIALNLYNVLHNGDI